MGRKTRLETKADANEKAEVRAEAEELAEELPPENDSPPDFRSPCVLGIDEAGRGPVLGPMVYGSAYIPKSHLPLLDALGVDDSKALREEQRDEALEKIKSAPFLRTTTLPLSAQSLSASMLQRRKYNLNLISHDAALSLVQSALDAGANITEVYVDTVGNAEAYAAKFRRQFPDLERVVVAKKADSKYRIVGAASIAAKTCRDKILREWNFPEENRGSGPRLQFGSEFGSGYPGDPKTKAWLTKNVDQVFGFPTLVRFSWGTTKSLLENHAVDVEWESDTEGSGDEGDEIEEESGSSRKAPRVKTADIASFFGGIGGDKSTGFQLPPARKRARAVDLPKSIRSLGVTRGYTLLAGPSETT